jgi:hypothetical protein
MPSAQYEGSAYFEQVSNGTAGSGGNVEQQAKDVVIKLGSFRCRDSNPGRSGESRVS